MPGPIDQILAALNTINRKLDVLMSQQDELNADEQAIQQAITNLGTAVTAIQNEITDLKNANPALDLSGLTAAVGSLQTAVGTVTAIAPPPAG